MYTIYILFSLRFKTTARIQLIKQCEIKQFAQFEIGEMA